MDARARPPRRQGEELAAAPQGRRRRRGATTRRCSPPRPTSCRSGRAGRSSRSGTGSGPWRASRAASPPSAAATTTTSRRGSPRRHARVGLAVRSPSAVLDGEICALDETGRSGFGLLQQGAGALVFVAFDVLEVDGEPLIDRTYTERREALEQLLDTSVEGVLVSPSFDDGARARARSPRARARRRRRQAGRLAVPARAPLDGLAQAEAEEQPGARRRRLHARPGPSLERDRRARARRACRRRAPLRGQRRHRVHRPRARPPRGKAEAAAAGDDAVRGGAEDAEGAARRRDVGRADARRADRVRRVDARRQAAGARLPRPARG